MLDCFSAQFIELTLKNNLGDYVTLDDVLAQQKITGNAIVFEGNPGMGKSTLAINICKRWAEGNLLQDCHAVILLLLRDPEIQGAESISDLLLILDNDMRKSVFTEISRTNGERICFLLEGYDELPKQSMNQFSIFSTLKEKLTKCTLIYTSRPEAHPYIKVPYSEVIKIDGFKNDSIDKYISSVFENVENGKELTDTLKSQVRNNPVVENILHIPINLAIVCLIFFYFSTLPETLTELYTLLCLRLILRHIITRTPNVEQIEKLTSLNKLPGSISEQFFQLCFLAHKGIEDRTIIFNSQYLFDIGVDESKISSLGGLLQVIPITTVYGREKSYNFLHLTLQEFCKAWYISKLSTDEQLKLLKTHYYDNRFKMVWRFYSGITGLKDEKVLNFMLPYKWLRSKLSKSKMIKLMYNVYEAHNDEVCRIAGDHCDGSFVDFYPEDLRFVTYSFNNHRILLQAFSYLLIHYKGILKVIDIKSWPITDREFTIMVNSLEKRLSLLTSDELIFKVSLRSTSQSYFLLTNLLAKQYPIVELHINDTDDCTDLSVLPWKKLPLYMRRFTLSMLPSRRLLTQRGHYCDNCLSSCRELLTQSNTLRVLDFVFSEVQLKLEVISHLADCRNLLLQHLRMTGCSLGSAGADKIGEMLAHNKSIVSIDLSDNDIHDKGVERIVHHLKIGNTLQCINLSDNSITAIGIDHLKKLLVTNSTLNNIDLSHNNLNYEDIYLFLNSLNTTMEYIGLYGYRFIPEAITAAHDACVQNIKSFGFVVHKHLSKPLMNALTFIQQFEVHITSEEVHYRMIETIAGSDNIKALELYYSCTVDFQMAQDLYVCLIHKPSIKAVTICVYSKPRPGTFLGLIKSVIMTHTGKISIKKFTYTGLMPLWINMSEFLYLLRNLPDTLEELTLNARISKIQDLQKLDDILHEINQLRSTKGVSNPLQLMIYQQKCEGFDRYL